MRYRAACPVLVTGSVRRDRIAALKLDRQEAEVIARGVRAVSIEALPSTSPVFTIVTSPSPSFAATS